MTILKKQLNTGKMSIDLTGPEGNAFCLLGYAKKISRELNLDGNAIMEEMKQGDYDHLVETFDKHFGEYVTLYRW
jgi:hypothetical protein